jgi:hypothetical protein
MVAGDDEAYVVALLAGLDQAFDGGTLSSDGGVVILREIEKKLGLATALKRCNSVSPNLKLTFDPDHSAGPITTAKTDS